MMRTERDRQWDRAKRRANKAFAALGGAEQYLQRTPGAADTQAPDWSWAAEQAYEDAFAVLAAASKAVGAEQKAEEKRLDIQPYRPYGRKFQRRW